VPSTLTVHPAITLDSSIQQQNESEQHWAVKSAICDRLRSDPDYTGTIETEKKTSDLIADIRCQLTESPADVPQQFVVEVETSASNKDRLRATIDHLKFGFEVYWVFVADALTARRKTESILSDHMNSQPSLGVASLSDGEISLGAPIRWGEFDIPSRWLGHHELYVPTYDRGVDCFNHGDFTIDGERTTIYREHPRGRLYGSRYLDEKQQTLPEPLQQSPREFLDRLQTGDIERVSPVRGPP